MIVLSIFSFMLLTSAGYAVYFKYLVLPYGGRGYSRLLEFKGLEVTVPALSLILLSVGMLSVVAVNHCSNEKIYKKIMKISLVAGLFLYSIIIFFGTDLRYRLPN
ncbi:hypothetical protein [Pseudomonas silesiensis]